MKINAFFPLFDMSDVYNRYKTLFTTLSNKKTISDHIYSKTYFPDIYVYEKGFVMVCILAAK